MVIKEITEHEFNTFILSYPLSSIYQTVEYGKTMVEQNSTPFYIGAYEGNMIGASLILIEKHGNWNYAYAPRGFLMDYDDKGIIERFTKEVKKFLNTKDIVAIKLCPMIIKNVINGEGRLLATNPEFDNTYQHLQSLGYHHLGFNAFFEALKPRFEAIIDLTIGYEQLFKNIKKEYKTKIRTASRHNIKIFRADKNELSLLYEQTKSKYPRDIKYFEMVYNEFNKTNKVDFYYATLETSEYLKTIQHEYETQMKVVNTLNSWITNSQTENRNKVLNHKMDADREFDILKRKLVEATNLASEHPNGIVLASVLITKHKDEITLLMDGYDPKFKSFSAKHLIIWKVIEKYSKLGFKTFNMGGCTDIRVKNKKFDGLNEFKTNFNANIVEYAGDFELVVNGAKYFLYRQTYKGKK